MKYSKLFMDRATQAKSKRDGLLSPKIEKAEIVQKLSSMFISTSVIT